jgi:enamine deaminase RidA (YjgF/YER057c/UK114 family)
MRKTVQTGAPWEAIAGYSRAIRVGDTIYVTGTTSLDAGGNLLHRGDAGAQTRRIFQIIRGALEGLDATLEDVVRTRMYVTDIAAQWEAVARVHGEVLGHVRPATTMVEVSALIDPGMLVEIEAVAIVEPRSPA